MIIKRYADLPITYAPDIGEVLLARRTQVDQWVKAVVVDARRNRAGDVRLKVQWLDSDPDAGVRHPKAPIVAGTLGWLVISTKPGAPKLIKQIDGGSHALR